MSSRAEKERLKAQQEKFQAALSNLLKDDDNKYCVDCDAKGKKAWQAKPPTSGKLPIEILSLSCLK